MAENKTILSIVGAATTAGIIPQLLPLALGNNPVTVSVPIPAGTNFYISDVVINNALTGAPALWTIQYGAGIFFFAVAYFFQFGAPFEGSKMYNLKTAIRLSGGQFLQVIVHTPSAPAPISITIHGYTEP